jgi:capsular polysaccharide biosynthesis protein
VELKRYLAVLLRAWWIVLTALAVSIAGTYYFIDRQPLVYESTGTFVVRPRSVETDDSVRAFDTLIRGVEITATYATIARSNLIRARAEAALDESLLRSSARIDAEVLTGTNVLSIAVRGPDPTGVQRLAAAVGDKTTGYVDELNSAWMLQPLDVPTIPENPVSPDKPLTLAVGTVLGALVGVAMASLRDYLSGPVRPAGDPDSARTEVDATEPPLAALGRQVREAQRAGRRFSLGVLTVAPPAGSAGGEAPDVRSRDLSSIADVLRLTLREGDALAHLSDGTFVALFPDLPADQAEHLLVGWEVGIASILSSHHTGDAPSADISTGLCEYRNEAFAGDEKARRIARILIRPQAA